LTVTRRETSASKVVQMQFIWIQIAAEIGKFVSYITMKINFSKEAIMIQKIY